MLRTGTLLTAGALLTALLSGCAPANKFEPPPPPEVVVQAPDQRTVTNYVGFAGRLEALDTIDVRARVSGYLRSLGFVDGERVEKGQQLFVIEPESYQAQLNAALAKLAQARAATNLAGANYARREEAYKTRAISEIDLLTAAAELESANAQVLAELAEVEKAKIDLSYTTNVAPAAGRISRRLVSVGNLVGGAEPTLLATMIVEDPIYVYFSVPERTLLELAKEHGPRGETPAGSEQLEVLLELADGALYDQGGRIDYVDPGVDPDTGTMMARAVFANPDALLSPGLYGKVLFPDVRTNALLVPDLSILRDIGGSYVLAVNQTNGVESRYVTRGPRIGNDRIIEEGLEAGERIVVEGVQRARPGMPVRIAGASQVGGAVPETEPSDAGTERTEQP